MRRADREIADRADIDRVLREAEVLRLAFARGDEPYIVPVSFGYDGESLYVHTALEGLKLDFVASNPRVCFECERFVRLRTHPGLPCRWSFDFESVIGHGRMFEIECEAEGRRALGEILRHYGHSGEGLERMSLAGTRVWRIEIESLSGKRSGDGKAVEDAEPQSPPATAFGAGGAIA